MIKKLFGSAVAIALILFPNPATTASGAALLVYIWFPGVFGKK